MKLFKCEICGKECKPKSPYGNTCCSVGCATAKQKRKEFEARMIEFIGPGKSEGEMKAHLIQEGSAYKRHGEYAINSLLDKKRIAIKNNMFYVLQAEPELEVDSAKVIKHPEPAKDDKMFMHGGGRWCDNCNGVENGHVRGYKRCMCKTPSWMTEAEATGKEEGILANEGINGAEGTIVMELSPPEIRKAEPISYQEAADKHGYISKPLVPSVAINPPAPAPQAAVNNGGVSKVNNKEASLFQLVDSIGDFDKLAEFAAAHKEISKIKKDLEDIEQMKREKQAELEGLSERYLLLKVELIGSMK